MNSTGQKIRGGQQEVKKGLVQSGNWSKMFPPKMETDVKSCTFVKKMITVALSNITYLRSMFPEEAYANRSLDGMVLKILREKNSCKEAKVLSGWLLGAFDALEKKYLRELMLAVYLDQSNPDKVHEMYTFRFSYPGGQASCQMFQGEDMKEVKNEHPDNIYKSTQNLLRTLVVLTQGLGPLPTSAFLSMKLSYYDEVTPEDYEPIGFKPTLLTENEMTEGCQLLKVGEVTTGFHAVRLKVQITPKQVVEINNEQPAIVTNNYSCSESDSDPRNTAAKQVMNDQGDMKNNYDEGDKKAVGQKQVFKQPPSVSLLQNSQIHVSDTTCISEPLVSSVSRLQISPAKLVSETLLSTSDPPAFSVSLLDNSNSLDPEITNIPTSDLSSLQNSPSIIADISCSCQNFQPDPLMLTCHHCGQRQHAACYRILKEEKIPVQHCCVACSLKESISCTDPKLVKISNKPAVSMTCIYRRVLASVMTAGCVTRDFISTTIGVSLEIAGQIITKLSLDKCVQESGGGYYTVDMKTLEMVALPKYLGVKKNVGNILCSIMEKTEDIQIKIEGNQDLIKETGISKRSVVDDKGNRRSKRFKGSRSEDDVII